MMNKDEQIKEYETYFYNFIFEEKSNKGLKKNHVKRKDNIGFVMLFCREIFSVFSHITFMIFVI